MESSLTLYNAYRERALSEIKQLDELSDALLPQTMVSRAYYAAFYAMKAQLAFAEVVTRSHKQALIEFRKHFIRTKRLSAKYSKLLTKLFEMRELADYDVMWDLPQDEFDELLSQVRELVDMVLELGHSK
ncbi:MAG: HEPN domain-containing protein [Pseudomonadota bacterium]